MKECNSNNNNKKLQTNERNRDKQQLNLFVTGFLSAVLPYSRFSFSFTHSLLDLAFYFVIIVYVFIRCFMQLVFCFSFSLSSSLLACCPLRLHLFMVWTQSERTRHPSSTFWLLRFIIILSHGFCKQKSFSKILQFILMLRCCIEKSL